MPSAAVFFVIDNPHLEAMSTLLLSSLRRQNGEKYSYFGYASAAYIDQISAPTRALFDACGLELRPLPEPGDVWKKPYPHGNKILAAVDDRGVDANIFLDTDMICCQPLDIEKFVKPDTVAVVPEGVPTWGNKSDRWQRAYDHFNLPFPTERVKLVRRKRIPFVPYFNAGMVAFSNAPSPQGKTFAQHWRDTASDFDWNADIGGKRPWLDQITLPLTMKRFGYRYETLPDVYNFSISDRPFEADAKPKICHYHRTAFFKEWPQCRDAIAGLRQIAGDALFDRLLPQIEVFT